MNCMFDKISGVMVERETDQDLSDRRGINETLNSVELIRRGTSENSIDSDVRSASETAIVIISDEENGECVTEENKDPINSSVKVNALELSKAVEDDEVKMKDLNDEKHSSVIDVKCGIEGNLDGERVCRICHLSSDQPLELETTITKETDLIQLGCGCKDELGIAHPHCADAWFKLKGNRLCEICGETAKNVTGIDDTRFMEEWNERRSSGSPLSSERSGGCWQGQLCYNFLMAFMVIAFVLPWVFRVNLF